MEKMSDKEMVETIKKTANLIEDAFNGVAIDTVEKLRAAAGRIGAMTICRKPESKVQRLLT